MCSITMQDFAQVISAWQSKSHESPVEEHLIPVAVCSLRAGVFRCVGSRSSQAKLDVGGDQEHRVLQVGTTVAYHNEAQSVFSCNSYFMTFSGGLEEDKVCNNIYMY